MKSKRTILTGAMIIAIASLLLPVMIQAGSLEPSGAPAPTMKTLDEIPPTWSQTIAAAERFEPVMGYQALLDKETGLVWMQWPKSNSHTWEGAIDYCMSLELDGRKGWHLPTIEQLASLVETVNSDLALPTGHPFTNVPGPFDFYWSATTYAADTTSARGVNFSSGVVSSFNKTTLLPHAWCVRGGQMYDTR